MSKTIRIEMSKVIEETWGEHIPTPDGVGKFVTNLRNSIPVPLPGQAGADILLDFGVDNLPDWLVAAAISTLTLSGACRCLGVTTSMPSTATPEDNGKTPVMWLYRHMPANPWADFTRLPQSGFLGEIILGADVGERHEPVAVSER